MTFNELEQDCESIQRSNDFTSVLKILQDDISLEKILVNIRQQKISRNKTNKNKYLVSEITDSKYQFEERMLDDFDKIINAYQFFLDRLLSLDINDYEITKSAITSAYYELHKLARAHDVNNRFMFTRKQIFFYRVKKDFHPVAFENLNLSQAQVRKINDLFQIRREAFDEMATRTEIALGRLENIIFTQSPLQLSAEAKSAVIELAVAFETLKGYVINDTDKKRIRQMMGDFFGISSREFTKKMSAIKTRKAETGHHLNIIAQALKQAFNRSKRLKDK